MYYKEDYLDTDLKRKYLTDYTGEFALALYDKLKETDNAFISIISFEKDGQHYKKALVSKESNEFRNSRYIDIQFAPGNYEHSYVVRIDGDNGIENIACKKIPATKDQLLKELGSFDETMYQNAKSIVADFNNIAEKGLIYDKNGDKYDFTLIENSDPTMGDILILDELRLYKEGKQVGYLKAQYLTDEIAEKLLKEDFSMLGKKHSKQDKIDYLTQKNIEFTNENLNIVFQLKMKMIKEEYKAYKKKNTYFDNMASVDFSRVETEGLGLGKQMYFKMAQHLNKKGVTFRASTLQSDEAKNLWDSIRKKHPEIIGEVKLGDKICPILNVTDDMDIFYKPKNEQKIKQKIQL